MSNQIQLKDQRTWAQTWLKQGMMNIAGGKTYVGTSERKFTVINPATELPLTSFNIASQADVERAAQAARDAFPVWSKYERRDRGRILMRLAQLIRDHAEELATLESLCNGKTYRESLLDDLPESAEVFEYYAGWVDKYYGETCPVGQGYVNYTVPEPVGVCGLIVPWNFPLLLACWKMAPALAMGNTIVVKPSEHTPLTLLRLCELIESSQLFPKGVVNLVIGDAETGNALTGSNLIDKISFTGSTAVGRYILKQAAESNLKRVTLELGGKSPNIIFADTTDLKAAIDRSFTAMFSHKAEKCSEPTKLIVERPIYDEVVREIARQANAVKCGDPFDPQVDQGPQCNKAQFEKVMSYIEIGKKDGSRLVAGGERDLTKGFYIRPTVFADVAPASRLAREEIFGPVLVIIPFDRDEDAIAIANDSPYGLAAGLWTKDVNRAHRVASALDAGMVFINRYGCYDFASPFGGVKQSGWGKEMAIHSLAAYTKLKSIWFKV